LGHAPYQKEEEGQKMGLVVQEVVQDDYNLLSRICWVELVEPPVRGHNAMGQPLMVEVAEEGQQQLRVLALQWE
jgi:hypothetical protein